MATRLLVLRWTRKGPTLTKLQLQGLNVPRLNKVVFVCFVRGSYVSKHVARPSEALKSVTHAGVTSGKAKLGALADKSGSMEPLERNETGQAIWEHWETNGGTSSWKSKDSNSWS